MTLGPESKRVLIERKWGTPLMCDDGVVAGASALDLERGLTAAVQSIKEWSHPVETRKEKAQVASISAHNDVKMGELVADAFERVGDDGVITVEAATREGDLPRGEHQRRLPPSGPTEKLAPTQLLRRPGRDECDAQLAILAARECAVATRVGAGHGTCW